MPRSLHGWVGSLHRWFGLTLGLWFALAGLLGSVLVFWHEIEDLEYPASAHSAAPASPAARASASASLEAVIEAALAARPKGVPHRLFLPEAPDRPVRVQMFAPNGPDAFDNLWVHVDPADARVLGVRVWGGAVIHTLYALHSGLLFGEVGQNAVGLSGFVLAAMVLFGLVLWLRRHGRPWRESLGAVKGLRGLRLLRNRHRTLGYRALLPLLLAALTGSGLTYPEAVRELGGAVLPAGPAAIHRPGTGPVDLAGAVAAAEAALPGWRVAWVELEAPEEEAPGEAPGEAPLRMVLHPADPWRIAGAGRATVDPETGAVLKASPGPPVETLRAWIMALHNGAAFGWPHRILVVLVGLAPAALGWFGLLAWRRRRAARTQAAAARGLPAAAE